MGKLRQEKSHEFVVSGLDMTKKLNTLKTMLKKDTKIADVLAYDGETTTQESLKDGRKGVLKNNKNAIRTTFTQKGAMLTDDKNKNYVAINIKGKKNKFDEINIIGHETSHVRGATETTANITGEDFANKIKNVVGDTSLTKKSKRTRRVDLTQKTLTLDTERVNALTIKNQEDGIESGDVSSVNLGRATEGGGDKQRLADMRFPEATSRITNQLNAKGERIVNPATSITDFYLNKRKRDENTDVKGIESNSNLGGDVVNAPGKGVFKRGGIDLMRLGKPIGDTFIHAQGDHKMYEPKVLRYLVNENIMDEKEKQDIVNKNKQTENKQDFLNFLKEKPIGVNAQAHAKSLDMEIRGNEIVTDGKGELKDVIFLLGANQQNLSTRNKEEIFDFITKEEEDSAKKAIGEKTIIKPDVSSVSQENITKYIDRNATTIHFGKSFMDSKKRIIRMPDDVRDLTPAKLNKLRQRLPRHIPNEMTIESKQMGSLRKIATLRNVDKRDVPRELGRGYVSYKDPNTKQTNIYRMSTGIDKEKSKGTIHLMFKENDKKKSMNLFADEVVAYQMMHGIQGENALYTPRVLKQSTIVNKESKKFIKEYYNVLSDEEFSRRFLKETPNGKVSARILERYNLKPEAVFLTGSGNVKDAYVFSTPKKEKSTSILKNIKKTFSNRKKSFTNFMKRPFRKSTFEMSPREYSTLGRPLPISPREMTQSDTPDVSSSDGMNQYFDDFVARQNEIPASQRSRSASVDSGEYEEPIDDFVSSQNEIPASQRSRSASIDSVEYEKPIENIEPDVSKRDDSSVYEDASRGEDSAQEHIYNTLPTPRPAFRDTARGEEFGQESIYENSPLLRRDYTDVFRDTARGEDSAQEPMYENSPLSRRDYTDVFRDTARGEDSTQEPMYENSPLLRRDYTDVFRDTARGEDSTQEPMYENSPLSRRDYTDVFRDTARGEDSTQEPMYNTLPPPRRAYTDVSGDVRADIYSGGMQNTVSLSGDGMNEYFDTSSLAQTQKDPDSLSLLSNASVETYHSDSMERTVSLSGDAMNEYFDTSSLAQTQKDPDSFSLLSNASVETYYSDSMQRTVSLSGDAMNEYFDTSNLAQTQKDPDSLSLLSNASVETYYSDSMQRTDSLSRDGMNEYFDTSNLAQTQKDPDSLSLFSNASVETYHSDSMERTVSLSGNAMNEYFDTSNLAQTPKNSTSLSLLSKASVETYHSDSENLPLKNTSISSSPFLKNEDLPPVEWGTLRKEDRKAIDKNPILLRAKEKAEQELGHSVSNMSISDIEQSILDPDISTSTKNSIIMENNPTATDYLLRLSEHHASKISDTLATNKIVQQAKKDFSKGKKDWDSDDFYRAVVKDISKSMKYEGFDAYTKDVSIIRTPAPDKTAAAYNLEEKKTVIYTQEVAKSKKPFEQVIDTLSHEVASHGFEAYLIDNQDKIKTFSSDLKDSITYLNLGAYVSSVVNSQPTNAKMDEMLYRSEPNEYIAYEMGEKTAKFTLNGLKNILEKEEERERFLMSEEAKKSPPPLPSRSLQIQNVDIPDVSKLSIGKSDRIYENVIFDPITGKYKFYDKPNILNKGKK